MFQVIKFIILLLMRRSTAYEYLSRIRHPVGRFKIFYQRLIWSQLFHSAISKGKNCHFDDEIRWWTNWIALHRAQIWFFFFFIKNPIYLNPKESFPKWKTDDVVSINARDASFVFFKKFFIGFQPRVIWRAQNRCHYNKG